MASSMSWQNDKNITYILELVDTSSDKRSFISEMTDLVSNIEFDWIYVGRNMTGDVYFMKSVLASGRVGESPIRVWVKQLSKSSKIENVTHKNVEKKILYSFNCEQKKTWH